MERINICLKFAILALTICSIHTGTAFQFQCDTPNEWFSSVGTFNFFHFKRWPNGIVTYALHTSLNSTHITEVFKAFYDIQNKTCIRFVPRGANDTSYVSIELDDSVCGLAHVCQLGGYQFAKFGSNCMLSDVIIHELGHSLCLGHEMQRIDRDDYVEFDGCAPEEIPEIEALETRGHFYDYTSLMAYQCNWCLGGFPKMAGVTKCGLDVQHGLSVLDSDKINDLYDCKGCYSHRWRRSNNITANELGEIWSFGKTVEYKDLHLCRTYVGPGEIAPGQYDLDKNLCTVTFNGTEFQVKDSQVFTVPDQNARERYGVFGSKEYLLPVGRTKDAVTIYAAVTEYQDYKGNFNGQAIGKVYASDLTKAYFSIEHIEGTKTKFSLIGCY